MTPTSRMTLPTSTMTTAAASSTVTTSTMNETDPGCPRGGSGNRLPRESIFSISLSKDQGNKMVTNRDTTI